MSDGCDSALEITALGRPFQPGMLYDARNDRLIPGMTLWDPNILKENIDSENKTGKSTYKISTEDTLKEKSEMLGISADLKLSVLSGLVEVSGSAEYINDRTTTEHNERLTLKYSTITRFDQLTMAHLGRGNVNHPEVFDKQIATHVVTAIQYGAEAFFIFDRSVSESEGHSKIHGSVKAVLDKIPKLTVSGTGELTLNDEEKQITEKLTCQFYGDFILEYNPSTFEEAVKLYKDLPTLLGPNNEKAVARRIWLYPLHLLDNSAAKISREISINLVGKSIELMEKLHQFKIKANDLKNSLSSNSMLKRIKQQFSTFSSRISEFETDLKKKLLEILPKIRSGTVEEKELAELFKQVDKSPFNEQKLEDWLETKTQEVEIVTNFVNTLAKENNIDLSQSSLAKAISNLDCKFVLSLVIHVIEKNEPFLSEMYQYLDGTYNGRHEPTSISHWFDQEAIYGLSRRNITLFINFAKANKDNKVCQLVANEEYSDQFQNKKGVSVIAYQNGSPTSFTICSKPEEVRATVLEDRTAKIEWVKPQFGSESVQKYEIYGQKNSNDQWNILLTTTDTTELAIIPNLDGKYQFKIRGITLFGVTPDSDASNTIEYEEFSEPGKCKKLDCKGRPCAKCHKCRDWHYTGDHDTWNFIKNCENWNNDDWTPYSRDSIWKLFTKRDGATCDGVFSAFSAMSGGSGAGAGAGGSSIRTAAAAIRAVVADFIASGAILHVCLCEMH